MCYKIHLYRGEFFMRQIIRDLRRLLVNLFVHIATLYGVSPTVFVHITQITGLLIDLCVKDGKAKNKKRKYLKIKYLRFVPRAGVEPARVAPLVFETSASTDSAIWA